jgi:prepilin-type N-terminal cleavage/methylation domain-containing protein
MLKKIQSVLKNNSGFSFMELMVVVALVGILSSIAIPNHLRSLPEKRLKNAARSLYADMQRARLLAVKDNRIVQVTFANNGYSFEQWDNTTNTFIPTDFQKDMNDFGEIGYGCTENFSDLDGNPPDTSNPDSITFRPTGTLGDGSASSAIFLGSGGVNACYAVTISNFGAVQILRQPDGGTWQ